VGYAVRLRPETAEHYECTYSGRFVSGGTSEPFTNGALCRSDVAGEPLWGIELHIAPRRILDAANPNAKIGASSLA
jgi:hypothetical protein